MSVQDELRVRLLAALSPNELEIRDDSAAHHGHAGAAAGGHFAVRIAASRFTGTRMLERHRLVYAAAGDLMQNGIHALSIDALAPSDITST